MGNIVIREPQDGNPQIFDRLVQFAETVCPKGTIAGFLRMQKIDKEL